MTKKTEAKNLAKTAKTVSKGSKLAPTKGVTAKKTYKLPNGKTTTNVGLYAAEWKSTADSLEMFMGNWKMTSMDPDVTYSTPNGNITLPLWAVQGLVKAITENAKEENEFVVNAVQGFVADLKW